MTPRKRVLLNVVATYGRSLYALVVGLFCGRWALMALGQVDYGLMGLIGGLVGCVSFLNGLLASAVGRFYGVSVGAAHRKGNEAAGLEECRRWFNTAFLLHTLLPSILMSMGYPIGIWAIHSFLTIPIERMDACVWVWRFTCVSCFMGMFSVPFNAMYTAKQEIAELTIYSFFTTTLNAVFLYYMVCHPGTWLTKYTLWTCLLGISPQFLIASRALIKYPECRFVWRYAWEMARIRRLAYFACARFWSEFSSLVVGQGQAILVNKYVGVIFNTSMAIGNTVAGHAFTLSGALDGALWPALTNKIGEGKHEEVRRLCFVMFRLCTLLILVFALPLMLEIHEVLRLWLGNPPPFAAEICVAVMVYGIFERMSGAYGLAIIGYGTYVMKYSWTVGCAGFTHIVVAWVCFGLGFGMWSIVAGLVVGKCVTTGVRLFYGREMLGITTWEWFSKVCFPICFTITVSLGIGALPRLWMGPSLLRVMVSSSMVELTLLPLAWCFVVEPLERIFILDTFAVRLPMLRPILKRWIERQQKNDGKYHENDL